ncbi:hypothetical protein [Clostridium intestinale]|uniref:hypothetical protein n=1 Tax=Clostridium intestinale TaxID=36845 RepID=UPI001FAB947F|nr:hypothetical protein [Clostridium intestinale]
MKDDINWKFSDVENTAVFTTKEVVKEGMPILYVSHDEDDGAWQFHYGSDVNIEDSMIVSLKSIVSLDNTLNQLYDLPLGWIATRKNIDSSWDKRINLKMP